MVAEAMGTADDLTRPAALAPGTRFDRLSAATVDAARAVTMDAHFCSMVHNA
jgi:hypothetical protein